MAQPQFKAKALEASWKIASVKSWSSKAEACGVWYPKGGGSSKKPKNKTNKTKKHCKILMKDIEGKQKMETQPVFMILKNQYW